VKIVIPVVVNPLVVSNNASRKVILSASQYGTAPIKESPNQPMAATAIPVPGSSGRGRKAVTSPRPIPMLIAAGIT